MIVYYKNRIVTSHFHSLFLILTYLHYILFYVSQKTFCRYYILSYVRQKTFCRFFFRELKNKRLYSHLKAKSARCSCHKIKKSAKTNVGIKWFTSKAKKNQIFFFLMQCPRRNLKNEEKIEENVPQIVLFCEF